MRNAKWIAMTASVLVAVGAVAHTLVSCTQQTKRVGYSFLPPPALLPATTQATPRTAQAWLDAARNAYAALDTYAEDGFCEHSLGDDTDISHARWQMRFARSGGFAFRFQQHGFLGTAPKFAPGSSILDSYEMNYLIWQTPGQRALSRWTVGDGKLEEHDSLGRPTGGAFGVTQQTSGWTLAMLDASQFSLIAHPLQLENAAIAGRAIIDGASCVVISGEWGTQSAHAGLHEDVRVYLDEQTLLVRRWERTDRKPLREGEALPREVWHVRPLANPTLGADAFAEPTLPLAPWDATAPQSPAS
jgi:hypothetical protein